MASISYGSGTPAPDLGKSVSLQSSYDTLKSVPTSEAGWRDGQAPQNPPVYGSGYSSGGNPLNQGEGSSGNG